MSMVSKIYLFFSWLVTCVIVMVIALMILRLIANAADLNPFGWTARSIRNATDPFLMPVRRGLASFGVDPKYAPLVTILLAILVGWLCLQVVSGVVNTTLGMVESALRGAFVPMIGYLLYGMLNLYALMIAIRIIFSWGQVSYANRLMRFLIRTTEPLLRPLRHIIPPLGMFDISPIVALFIIWLFQSAVYGTLLRGLRIQFLS
jgi:YggT family protein